MHRRSCGHQSISEHSGGETKSRLYRASKYVSSKQMVPKLCYSPPAVAAHWTFKLATLRESREIEHNAEDGYFFNIILTAYYVCVKTVYILKHIVYKFSFIYNDIGKT